MPHVAAVDGGSICIRRLAMLHATVVDPLYLCETLTCSTEVSSIVPSSNPSQGTGLPAGLVEELGEWDKSGPSASCGCSRPAHASRGRGGSAASVQETITLSREVSVMLLSLELARFQSAGLSTGPAEGVGQTEQKSWTSEQSSEQFLVPSEALQQ